MATVKCNRCGKNEITNVEPWLLEGTEHLWQCRNCFFVKEDGTRIVAASATIAEVLGNDPSDQG